MSKQSKHLEPHGIWSFKLSYSDREFLRQLAAERGCSSTDVLRGFIAAERAKSPRRNHDQARGAGERSEAA